MSSFGNLTAQKQESTHVFFFGTVHLKRGYMTTSAFYCFEMPLLYGTESYFFLKTKFFGFRSLCKGTHQWVEEDEGEDMSPICPTHRVTFVSCTQSGWVARIPLSKWESPLPLSNSFFPPSTSGSSPQAPGLNGITGLNQGWTLSRQQADTSSERGLRGCHVSHTLPPPFQHVHFIIIHCRSTLVSWSCPCVQNPDRHNLFFLFVFCSFNILFAWVCECVSSATWNTHHWDFRRPSPPWYHSRTLRLP